MWKKKQGRSNDVTNRARNDTEKYTANANIKVFVKDKEMKQKWFQTFKKIKNI